VRVNVGLDFALDKKRERNQYSVEASRLSLASWDLLQTMRRKRTDQGSVYMQYDGTRYDEAMAKNDRHRKQGDYSISRPFNKVKYNKPVLAKKSNERWGLDTMKMARYSISTNQEDEDKPFQKNLQKMNRGGTMTNILTVIDYFSKKVWARAMEKGTSMETAEAFKTILQEVKTIPSVLHHDDGQEFEKGFKRWLMTSTKTN